MVRLISVRACLAVGFMDWQGFAAVLGVPGSLPLRRRGAAHR